MARSPGAKPRRVIRAQPKMPHRSLGALIPFPISPINVTHIGLSVASKGPFHVIEAQTPFRRALDSRPRSTIIFQNTQLAGPLQFERILVTAPCRAFASGERSLKTAFSHQLAHLAMISVFAFHQNLRIVRCSGYGASEFRSGTLSATDNRARLRAGRLLIGVGHPAVPFAY